MGFQSRWKLPLSIIGPRAKMSWCHVVRTGNWQANTSTRSRPEAEFHLHTSSLFILDSVSEFDSNTHQPRSTGHDLSLKTTLNKKMETEPEVEWQFYSADAEIFGAFLLRPRDVGILFCLLKHQLFIQGVWNKDRQAVNFPFFVLRWVSRDSIEPTPD